MTPNAYASAIACAGVVLAALIGYLSSRNAASQTRQTGLESLLSSRLSQAENFTETIRKADTEQINRLQAQIDEQRTEIDRLRSERLTLREEILALKADVSESKEQMESFGSEMEGLRAQLREARELHSQTLRQLGACLQMRGIDSAIFDEIEAGAQTAAVIERNPS